MGNDGTATDPNAALKAEVERAELEARKAKAAAEARTASANAAKADAEARAAQAERDEYASPEAALARDAKYRQDAAASEQQAFASRTAQVKALIPDLTAVNGGGLAADTTGPAPGSTTLTFGGIDDAAEAIAARIGLADTMRILVTCDPDLASQDGVHLDVTSGLDGLHGQAAALTADVTTRLQADADQAATEVVERQTLDEGAGPMRALGSAAGGPAMAALAAAVPGVLSLLSVERALSSKAITVTDLAAAAAVAGALVNPPTGLQPARKQPAAVVHDTFRMVQAGAVKDQVDLLAKDRTALASAKLDLAERKAAIERDLDLRKAALKDIEDETDKLERPLATEVQNRLDLARARVAALHGRLVPVVTLTSQVEALIALIDAFTTAIRTIPAGARRTPLATATLYDQLHGGANAFTHVLLVVAQQGTSTQLTADKPLWFADRFATYVEVAITFALITVGDSAIVAAGTETTVIAASGSLGDQVVMKIESPREAGRMVAGQPWNASQVAGDRTG